MYPFNTLQTYAPKHNTVSSALVLAAAISMAVLVGCSGNSILPPPPPRGMTVVSLDSIWVVDSEQMHAVSIRVEPPELAEGRAMLCQIVGDGVSTHFGLYDDGGHGRWYDSVGFADSISGDHSPGNGIFTRRVSSLFTRHEGEYNFIFALEGRPPPDTLAVSVNVRRNAVPEIVNFDFPDSVESGEELMFSAVVTDSNSQTDIVKVELVSGDFGDISLPMIPASEDTWIFSSPSIAAGLATGSHPVFVRTSDYYLEQIGQSVESDPVDVWLENLPPEIMDVVGPDTIRLPVEGVETFGFEIVVVDDQGAGDLGGLLLQLTSTSGVEWDTLYYDDGTGADSTAGDGLYHAGFSVNDRNTPNVLYTFTWTPTDRSPQQGQPFISTVLFLPPEGSRGCRLGGDGLMVSRFREPPYEPNPFR